GKQTVREAEAAVLNRLRSLAETHVMLMDKEWQGANLAEVVCREMSPYAGRVEINGPDIMLPPKAAQNFALALHELSTNAAKHGALSRTRGRVRINWHVATAAESSVFTFRWEELGGPPVNPPTEKGFGSAVLEQVMADYCDRPPRIEFAPTGI